jgi:hypothetical protein
MLFSFKSSAQMNDISFTNFGGHGVIALILFPKSTLFWLLCNSIEVVGM